MADEAVDVKAYYEQHADKEREYVRVYSALPAKPGDHWVASVGGLNIQQGVKEDGFILKAYSGMHDTRSSFLDRDEFAEKAVPADKLYPAEPPADLDADDLAALTPIKKGKDFIALGMIAASAECDGFLYKGQDGKNTFLSNYSVSAAFNYAGKKFETDGAQVVSLKDEPALKGIILDEDVTFSFKSGPYEAKKGSFVCPNPDDEDGFTAYPPGFAGFGLRRTISDEAMAQIADVRTDENIKVGAPLHFKPKK